MNCDKSYNLIFEGVKLKIMIYLYTSNLHTLINFSVWKADVIIDWCSMCFSGDPVTF